MKINCFVCSKIINSFPSQPQKYCKKCFIKNILMDGTKRKNFNEKIIDKTGYVLVYDKSHPFRDGHNRVREHRIIMEKFIGRYLNPKEVVHHINRDPSDNRIKNLQLFSCESEHRHTCYMDIFERQKILFKGRQPANKKYFENDEKICEYCGKPFKKRNTDSSNWVVKRFCGVDCRNLSRYKYNRDDKKVCICCGNTFCKGDRRSQQWTTQKFCSNICANHCKHHTPSQAYS